MMYLRWLSISIYAIATTLLAMVLTPFVVPFANRKTGLLPWPFHWMETPDVLLPADVRALEHAVLERLDEGHAAFRVDERTRDRVGVGGAQFGDGGAGLGALEARLGEPARGLREAAVEAGEHRADVAADAQERLLGDLLARPLGVGGGPLLAEHEAYRFHYVRLT